jgi:hypothetical protein
MRFLFTADHILVLAPRSAGSSAPWVLVDARAN